jgi:hypothetical protein
MGQLVADNARLAQRPRSAEAQQRIRRNDAEILDCQIALQTARIAARPAGSADDLQSGLATLYRNRAKAMQRIQAGNRQRMGLRHRAQQVIGRS